VQISYKLHNKKSGKFAALFFLFFLTSLIYFPHSDGIFILDDIPNLNGLNNINDSPLSFQSLLEFLANNSSGQLGRPLSLLTFALQAPNWPDNAQAFKYVNISIHLINGLLVYFVSIELLKTHIQKKQTHEYLPIVIAGLWLIQPIHVSTSLYIVQRMTLLMAFFSLLTLYGYLICIRISIKNNILLAIVIIGGTLFATLSKENGVLTLLYIAIIELTIFSNIPKTKKRNLFKETIIYLPLLIGGIYFAANMPDFIKSHAGRNFTFSEHIYTNSRVLIDYLGKILIPRPNSFGLFFDDYKISRSLFLPITTLISTCILLTLFVSSIIFRHKQPIYSFAVLWFFVGHSLESSVIPLELYFEHRNYLPAFGVIFALCYYSSTVAQKASVRYVKISLYFLFVLYISVIYIISLQEAKLWNNSSLQAFTWQNNHPTSKRANALVAQAWMDLKQPLKADQQLQLIYQHDEHDSAALIMRLYINCHTNHMDQETLMDISTRLKKTHSSIATAMSTKSLVTRWGEGKCPALSDKYLENILDSIYENTIDTRINEHIAQSFSLFYAFNNNYDSAVGILEHAQQKTPSANGLSLLKIRWAIASKQYSVALSWIKSARNNHSAKRLNKINFENQLRIMENDIHEILNNYRENPA
jgi:protein O-mannosyl-transferase